MRLLGYACAGTALVGLAAFGLQGRSSGSSALHVPDAAPSPSRGTAESSAATEEAASAEFHTATQDDLAVAERDDPGREEPEAERDETGTATPDRGDRDDRRWYRRRSRYTDPIPSPADWEPPEGPVRIALQAGHWRADEAPRELDGLRGGGTRANGMAEWEANLEIARRAGAMLEERGYEVDILPAVVPPGYRAHLFISIHADGSADPNANGYRVAAPRRDATGRASQIVALLEDRYGRATGLRRLPDVTRRMRNYYAFNYRRYEHALHPMTIGAIIETGFLTSSRDRQVIVSDPDRAARGIVEAIMAFPVTAPPVQAGAPATRSSR